MPRFDINDVVEMSRLVTMAKSGDKIFITENDQCVAKMVVTPLFKGVRKPGSMAGKIWIADDFDDPLPEDIHAAFEGK